MTGTTRSSADLDPRRRKALFRSWHRGTREMDLILGGFADDRIGELAALLAHEGTHVAERHSTRMLMRQLASYVFISMLIGDASAIVAVVAENADNIRNLSYTRGLEEDADRHGMERLHARGVDPQGMVELLKLLNEEAMEIPQAMQFLSSHPLTQDRISTAETEVSKLGPMAVAPLDLVPLFTAVRGNK